MLAPTIQQMEKVARDDARTANGCSSQVPFDGVAGTTTIRAERV